MNLEYPKVNYPTIIEGFVSGDQLRLESLDGSERVETPETLPLGGWLVSHGGIWLQSFGPVDIDGKTWGVSHQQKYSHHGWLKANPDCYHRWCFWRLQKKDAQGGWLPGTERGIYFRKPFSWRWDVAGTNGKHWIWTNGFLGMRWD